MFDRARADALWASLNQPVLNGSATSAANASPLNFEDAVAHFAGRPPMLLNVTSLSADNIRFLTERGVDPQALRHNLVNTIGGIWRDSRAFQLTAIREKAVYARCPYRGVRLTSRHSLLASINVVFYRFVSSHVFYIVASGIGTGFQKSAIYLPEYDMLFTTGSEWNVEAGDVAELKARMVCNAAACERYLLAVDSRPARVAVCAGFYQFAHHLWNELPGFERLNDHRLMGAVDAYAIMREPLGPLDEIFPELAGATIERFSEAAAMFAYLLDGNYLAVRVGGNAISTKLVRRVNAVAQAHSLPETREAVRRARDRHRPIFWFGIRVGNRMWVEQACAIADVVSNLTRDFPNAAYVFDGFSIPADRSDADFGSDRTYRELVDAEKAVIAEIVSRLAQLPTQPTVFAIAGGSIYDANVWANAIDVYLSPYGTLQHKPGWFAAKRGLIHGNRFILERQQRYVWAARAHAPIPAYVPLAAVSDVPAVEAAIAYNALSDAAQSGAGVLLTNERALGRDEFANYSIAWPGMTDALAHIVRRAQRSARPEVQRLKFDATKRLGSVIRRAFRTFDREKL